MLQPITQIQQIFRNGSPALMPYFTFGYPDYETSLDIIQTCAESGADLMELGIPFSDPLADGPVIQASTHLALENGINTAKCLEATCKLRERGVKIPLMLMSYYNPLLSYGVGKFVRDACLAGANGLIIPDLPPEEAKELADHCRDHGLAISFLISPNSTDDRIKLITDHSTGFIYLVSVLGTTGVRSIVPKYLESFVKRIRVYTSKPLAVGFGISTPAQARMVGQFADGVIVGSAFVKTIQQAIISGDPLINIVREFIQSFSNELKLGEKRPIMDSSKQISMEIRSSEKIDSEEIEQLTLQLIRELQDLDVGKIHLLEQEKAPLHSKAGDPITWGTLLLTLLASGGVLTTLIGTLQAWLVNHQQHSVTLEIDGDKIEVKGISSEEQKKLIDAWLTRHKIILLP